MEPANGPYRVKVTWETGEHAGQASIIDLAPVILTFKVFIPLRDDARLFRTVRLGQEGGSIVWQGNEDLDIGVDTLEDLLTA